MEAYEEMIQETATKETPGYVVPADNKWFTRVVLASAVIETWPILLWNILRSDSRSVN